MLSRPQQPAPRVQVRLEEPAPGSRHNRYRLVKESFVWKQNIHLCVRAVTRAQEEEKFYSFLFKAPRWMDLIFVRSICNRFVRNCSRLLLWLSSSGLTIHLSLIWQDDFPPATGRVDGEGFLKALLDIRAPHALGVPVQGLVLIVPVQPIFWATVGAPLVGRNGGGSPWARPRAPISKDL